MKTQKATFVIVKQNEGQYGFFENYVSFNKLELDIKCAELNEEANAKWKANFIKKRKRSKKAIPDFVLTTIFTVMDLEKAIETFAEKIAYSYQTEDESL